MKDVIQDYQRMYLERVVEAPDEHKSRAMRVVAGRCDHADQLEESLMALGLIPYRY